MVMRIPLFLFVLGLSISCSTCLWTGTNSTADCDYRGSVNFTASADGSTQYFYLELPDNYDSTKTYPLIVYYHGWSKTRMVYNESYYDTFRALARAQGYIVASPDYRLKSWMNSTARSDVYDIVGLLNRTFLLNRTGLYQMGESQGGMAVFSMARSYPGLFRAQADLQGLTNLTSFYGEDESISYRDSMESALGGPPSASSLNYEWNSAAYNATDFWPIATWALYGSSDVVVLPKYGALLSLSFNSSMNYLDYRLAAVEHSYGSISGYEQSILNFFNISNYGPVSGNVTIQGDIYSNLTVISSIRDIEADNYFNRTTRWYKNGAQILKLNFPFETGSNSTWTEDIAGTRNALNLQNVTWSATAGHDGRGAYQFNGATSKIDLGTAEALYGYGALTFCAWIYPVGLGESSAGRIIDDGTLRFVTYTGNKLALTSDASVTNIFTGPNSIALNTWQHVCFSRLSNGSAVIYINGSSALSSSKSGTPSAPSNNITIGNDDLTTRTFNGTIDEVLIWTVALTPEQILSIYENGADRVVSGEKAQYDSWKACVCGFDQFSRGPEACSAQVSFFNVTLNSSQNLNQSSENLTSYISLRDLDRGITDWRLWNSSAFNSVNILNMPFDGNMLAKSGTRVKDYSSYGHQGVVYNSVAYCSGCGWNSTGAFQFDGVDDYIRLVSPTHLGVGKVSFGAWVYIKGVSSTPGSNYFITKGRNASTMSYGASWDDSVNYFGCAVTTTISSLKLTSQTKRTASDSVWTHVFCTYDQNNLSIYVNGVLENSSYIPGTIDYGLADNDLHIGDWGRSGFERRFNGTIDEVLIYDRALSPDQVKAIYDNRTDMVVSQETAIGDIWQACVTPNNGSVDWNTSCSNNITILPVTHPYLQITSPLSMAYTSREVLVNITNSSGVDSVWFFNGTGNQTYIYGQNGVVIEFPYGANAITAWANDSLNNINVTSVAFTIPSPEQARTAIPTGDSVLEKELPYKIDRICPSDKISIATEPRTSISVSNLEVGRSVRMESDSSGEAVVSAFGEGQYRISLSHVGYKAVTTLMRYSNCKSDEDNSTRTVFSPALTETVEPHFAVEVVLDNGSEMHYLYVVAEPSCRDGIILFTVLDAESGLPLPGTPTSVGVSDNSGRFSTPYVAKTRITIEASAGYGVYDELFTFQQCDETQSAMPIRYGAVSNGTSHAEEHGVGTGHTIFDGIFGVMSGFIDWLASLISRT